MKDYSYVFNAHPTFIEKMYKEYHQDPNSVDSGWRTFFEGFEFAGASHDSDAGQNGYLSGNVTKEFGVLSLIHGFRTRGHLLSDTNPSYYSKIDFMNFEKVIERVLSDVVRSQLDQTDCKTVGDTTTL